MPGTHAGVPVSGPAPLELPPLLEADPLLLPVDPELELLLAPDAETSAVVASAVPPASPPRTTSPNPQRLAHPPRQAVNVRAIPARHRILTSSLER